MNDMRIEFGTLHDVFGKAATRDGLSIVPAMVQLNGDHFSTGFALRDAAGPHPPAILASRRGPIAKAKPFSMGPRL